MAHSSAHAWSSRAPPLERQARGRMNERIGPRARARTAPARSSRGATRRTRRTRRRSIQGTQACHFADSLPSSSETSAGNIGGKRPRRPSGRDQAGRIGNARPDSINPRPATMAWPRVGSDSRPDSCRPAISGGRRAPSRNYPTTDRSTWRDASSAGPSRSRPHGGVPPP